MDVYNAVIAKAQELIIAYEAGCEFATKQCVDDLRKIFADEQAPKDNGMGRGDFSRLLTTLHANGYKTYSCDMDADFVAEQHCLRCRGNMSYIGRRKAGSYRAFMQCLECGATWEF